MVEKIDLTGKTGHHEIVLDREGMEVLVVGSFELDGKKDESVSVMIRHTASHTTANTLLKGVVRGGAHLKIEGTIRIEKNTKGCESFLREKVLLLSPTARAEAIPNLEILADEVKCSHAATLSNIPEAQLFYLMSRGMNKPAAEKLIVEGFLSH